MDGHDRGPRAALDRLATRVQELDFRPQVEDLGRVRQVSGGVALLDGLAEVAIDEVVAFEGGLTGQVFDLDRSTARCVLFGPEEGVRAGAQARRTRQTPTIPVGDGLRGRVLDPLGIPQDGLGPLPTTERAPIERDAPGPLARQPVKEPLFTGIKAIDAVTPIGRGQRQLILGDRSTGKTSLALDAILNQRADDVACVYVSIGAKSSSVVEVIDELRRNGALDRTTVVVASAEDPAAIRYLAPYAGCAIAEWYADQGRHALIVYDDLTRHAEAYRELSLLLRRPPSREAYPGDIFSVHARLMERAFKLSAERGGGSVTALPIAETQRGNIAGFIPTNLISMTDGQVVLDTTLFAEGQLPAIDVGLSVSRVGGDAQPGTMREATATLRLEVGQYEEVKGFARFGAILDVETTRQIARGKRLLRLLAQPERAVVPVAVQVAVWWAFREGLLDDVEPERIVEVEDRLRANAGEMARLDRPIRSAATITDALANDLRTWVTAAKAAVATNG